MTMGILAAYLLVLGATGALALLNRRHLRAHGAEVPPELADAIDPATLRRITAYTLDTSRLRMIRTTLRSLLLILFLFGGVLGLYDRWVSGLTASFVWGGVLFFLILVWVELLVGIPFSLYRNFRVEARHGFNTLTGRLWFTDFLKSAALSTLISSTAIASALFLVRLSPGWWWLWVWGFFLLFSLFLMYVSPYVIEPLFFKLEPVRVEGLSDRIRSLMERTGLRVKKVFQVDASRRSRHSNAYFTGIGKVKRIVLFDTLMEQMNHEEILAVLAHEAGHWKKRHVLKRIVRTEALALGGSYLAFRLLDWEGLPGLVGLETASFYARLVILGFLASLILFPFTPLFSFFSRRAEREADRYAGGLTGRPGDLASALVKLSRENLANLHPHPLYARFYYSHPPVVERIRALRAG